MLLFVLMVARLKLELPEPLQVWFVVASAAFAAFTASSRLYL